MAGNKTTSLGDLVNQAPGMFAANPMIAPQLEQFWKAQDSILHEAEKYARAWFERRHAATRSALDVAREASGNGNAGSVNALGAISDWQRGSTERMAADVQAWVEFCARCAGHFANAETAAAKEGMEAAEKGAVQVAKSQHTTAE